MKLPCAEYQWTLLLISQHCFRLWFDAIRQQSITWASVDPDLCRHMPSLGTSELMYEKLRGVRYIPAKWSVIDKWRMENDGPTLK